MNVEDLKREALALIDRLPEEELSWHGLAYHFSVRGVLESRLAQGDKSGVDTATLRLRWNPAANGGRGMGVLPRSG